MKGPLLTIWDAIDARGAAVAITGVTVARVRRSILHILAANVLCALATVNHDHSAHINTAYFSFSADFELYFLSHPRSLHCQNLGRNASMAAAVYSSQQNWTGPDQGLQLFGTCAPAEGPQLTRAARIYGARFPQYRKWKSGLKASNPAQEYRLYRFVPAQLKVFDESAFGEAVFVRAAVGAGDS
jgi:uncharacterized protein YhbP (UPF0306 family)